MKEEHQSQTKRLVFFIDFDGTITKEDTLAAFAKHVGYTNPYRVPGIPPWSYYVDCYARELFRHKRDYQPPAELPDYPNKVIAEAIAYQRSLRDVEHASFMRVALSGLFDEGEDEGREWMPLAGNAVRAGDLKIRRGFHECLETMKRFSVEENVLQVLSVSFDELWIHAVFDYLRAPDFEILAANSLISRQHLMQTCRDKRETMERAMKGFHGTDFVYIGDSTTDIECLLAADYGICIRDEPMRSGQKEMAKLLESAGVTVRHVHEEKVRHTEGLGQKDKRVLMWARDLQEVNEWLLWSFGEPQDKIPVVRKRKLHKTCETSLT